MRRSEAASKRMTARPATSCSPAGVAGIHSSKAGCWENICMDRDRKQAGRLEAFISSVTVWRASKMKMTKEMKHQRPMASRSLRSSRIQGLSPKPARGRNSVKHQWPSMMMAADSSRNAPAVAARRGRSRKS